jgi:hypothetical protein
MLWPVTEQGIWQKIRAEGGQSWVEPDKIAKAMTRN